MDEVSGFGTRRLEQNWRAEFSPNQLPQDSIG
jgi:hypothetical protein